jgi:Kef-type K+ transport system membrane component KefB
MEFLDFIRAHSLTLPPLAKLALALGIIFVIPRLSSRVHLPGMVGLLLTGVVIGPHVLGFFGEDRPIMDFFAELGKLLLMFTAGLEIDLALFRRAKNKSILFGLITTGVPLALGTGVGLLFGYGLITAIVVGSLLASHTLLGMPILAKLGRSRSEPVIITVGATVLSDTLSLLVFAICVSTYERGFSVFGATLQLVEIAAFVPLILFGLSRLGAYALKKVEGEEDAYFVLIFGIMAVASILAGFVSLPGIVGAFLAGLAVNAAVHDKPAVDKLEFFGKSLFVPCFYVGTGFLIDPIVFFRSLIDNFALTAAIILALIGGKRIAAEIAGRTFKYSSSERLIMWSLTMPQVAATLAATLVAFKTFDPAGQRLIDHRILNAVFVLVLFTSILGPVLTQRFAPRMLEDQTRVNVSNHPPLANS